MNATDETTNSQKAIHRGKVGFFWIVPDRLWQDAILGEAIDLSQAEAYGEALTHPGGHYDFWQQMKARGPAWLRARNISGRLLATEYEDWPRGRLVFFPAENAFTLSADRRIVTPSRLNKVRSMFEVPELNLNMRGDSHYVQIP